MQLVPYVGFDSRCREAFEFYHRVLGGEIVAMFTHGETPAASHMPPEARDTIMHARLELDGATLMGGDAPPGIFERPRGFCVSLDVATPAEAERIFPALSEGGEVQMPLQETFWAERFAMFTDRFGTPWMINCEKTQSGT
jgi:PhnB protein